MKTNPPEKVIKTDIETFICPRCGKAFIRPAHNINKKYCSRQCTVRQTMADESSRVRELKQTIRHYVANGLNTARLYRTLSNKKDKNIFLHIMQKQGYIGF